MNQQQPAFDRAMSREMVRRKVMRRVEEMAADCGRTPDDIRGLTCAVRLQAKALPTPFDWSLCEVDKVTLIKAQAEMSRAAIMRFIGDSAEAEISENVANRMLSGAYTFSQPDGWVDQFFEARYAK